VFQYTLQYKPEIQIGKLVELNSIRTQAHRAAYGFYQSLAPFIMVNLYHSQIVSCSP
jgi:hypothetical protein